MTETTHSQVGASSCERWWNCPGSVRLAASMPPQPVSSYAKDGTKAHAVAEFALRKNVDAFKASEMYDKDDGVDVGISMEMVEAVQVYLDVIDEDIFKYKMKKSDLEIEKQFVLSHIHPNARGTNDANLGVFLDRLIVYDFKYGKGVAVEAEENKQGMYYALGALQGGDYDTIEIVIVQPRAIHRDGPVRRWTISKSDLLVFGRELKGKIIATEDVDARLTCGDWCQKYFCPALAVCPAVRGKVDEVAVGIFDSVAPKRDLPIPETLSQRDLKNVLDTIPILDAWIKAVEEYSLNLANNGGIVEGYKLVQKRAIRQWKDERDVIDQFGKIAYVEKREVLSPAKLEAALKAASKSPKKEIEMMIAPYTYKPDTGTVLVPETDPREAVRPKLESVFSNEQEQDIFS
jgi:uncharacterized protein DUF2800